MHARTRSVHYAYLAVLMLIMLVPVIATFMYALSSNWSRTILPEIWTTQWLIDTWTNPRFLKASFYSVLLSTVAAVLSIVIVFPVLMAVHTSHPKWEKWINPILVLPFTLPPVVASAIAWPPSSGLANSDTSGVPATRPRRSRATWLA